MNFVNELNERGWWMNELLVNEYDSPSDDDQSLLGKDEGLVTDLFEQLHHQNGEVPYRSCNDEFDFSDMFSALTESTSSTMPQTKAYFPQHGFPDLVTSTITMQFSVSQTIDIGRLPRAESENGDDKTPFKNCVSVAIPLSSQGGAKASVFKNGTVKIMGCRSDLECTKAIETTLDMLKVCSAVQYPTSLVATQPEVHMRKADGMLFPLCLFSALKVLRRRFVSVEYDPKVYSGLKIRCDIRPETEKSMPPPTRTKKDVKPPCIIIFRTGRVSGMARNQNDINKAYRLVVDCLLNGKEQLCAEAHKACDRESDASSIATKRKSVEADNIPTAALMKKKPRNVKARCS